MKINWSKIATIFYIFMIFLLVGTCVAYVSTKENITVRNIGLTITYIDMVIVFLSLIVDAFSSGNRKRKEK